MQFSVVPLLEVASFRKIRSFGQGKQMLAEVLNAALYYGRVHVYMEYGVMADLVEFLTWRGFLTLVNHSSISVTFLPEEAAIYSDGFPRVHSPIFFSSALSSDSQASWAPEDVIGKLFKHRGGVLATVRKQEIKRLLEKYKPKKYATLLGQEGKDQKLWSSLATDPATLRLAIRAYATSKAGIIHEHLLEQTSFQVYEVKEGQLVIDSSNPLEALINVPDMSDLTWAHILAEINEFRLDMYFAATVSSDLILSPKSASFATARVDMALNRGLKNIDKIQHFNDILFENGKPLGEMFLAGTVSLGDALKIIDQAGKFRSHILAKPHDADLLREYFTEVAKLPWLETSAGKTVRLLVCTGLGVVSLPLSAPVGIGIGAAIGAFDSFVLPKILDLWKPTVFVQTIERKLQQ